MLSYELLQPQDIQQFIEIFPTVFGRVPDMRSTTAVVGKDEKGVIKSFVCLANITVLDGMWISPEYRHKGVWRKLLEKVLTLPWGIGEGFYLLCGTSREVALAKWMKMVKTPFTIWRKRY